MEDIVTSLFNRVKTGFTDRLKTKNIDINLTNDLLDEIIGKLEFIIKSLPKDKPDNENNDFSDNYEQAQIELLKSNLYIAELKRFEKKLSGDASLKNVPITSSLDSADNLSKSIDSTDEIEGGRKKIIDRPKTVLLDGLTEKGSTSLTKTLKPLFDDVIKAIKTSNGFDEKNLQKLLEDLQKPQESIFDSLADLIPSVFGIPGRRGKPEKPKSKSTPKKGPKPKGVPIPGGNKTDKPKSSKPAPSKPATPSPKGGPKGGGLARFFLPVVTAIEAVSNISDSIGELQEKETLGTAQKLTTGGMALAGGAADIISSLDPTSWGIDKMLGYDVFGEGLLKEGLNIIGAKEEDQTMGESLRGRFVDFFESYNQALDEGAKYPEKITNNQFDSVDILPYLNMIGKVLPTTGMPLYIDALTKTPGTQKPIPTDASPPVPLKDGGIVTEPTKAVVGEAGPEAVLPLNDYFNPENFNISNDTLKKIVDNTGTTNTTLKQLTDAIFKLASIFDKKMSSTTSNTTLINGSGGQAKEQTPASHVAASNVDPIRRVRAKFA